MEKQTFSLLQKIRQLELFFSHFVGLQYPFLEKNEHLFRRILPNDNYLWPNSYVIISEYSFLFIKATSLVLLYEILYLSNFVILSNWSRLFLPCISFLNSFFFLSNIFWYNEILSKINNSKMKNISPLFFCNNSF